MLLGADSESIIKDTIYPKRKMHVGQLSEMGAKIRVTDDNLIVIDPSDQLRGTTVSAGEIRAGASLVIAGLTAKGETIVTNTDNILRGYDNIVKKLTGLHAEVELIK